MNEAIWPAALDLGDSTPLYRQLENIALSAIRSGALRPGDLLPSEGELCARYGLSRSTVRQAFAGLEEKDLVLRRRGLGSFVAEPKVSRNLDDLYSFTSQLRGMGYTTSSQVLELAPLALDTETARGTGLAAGTPVWRICRLRLANGLPLLLETTLIVRSFCPQLSAAQLETGSLYRLLTDAGLVMDRAVENYEPIVMDRETRRLLHCETNACAFLIHRRAYTRDGELFEVTRSVMPGQRSRLEVTLKKDGVTLHRYDDRARPTVG